MFHISRRVGKPWDSLTQYLRRIEQLAAIRKTQELPTETQELPEYTPPEGWRVLAVGEELREGDVIVHADDAMYATARAGKVVQANQRYIRPIEPQPQSELQQADTPATEYTPPEGWRVVRYGELLLPGDVWVNWEGTEARPDILHGDGATASGGRYIRRIEGQPQPVQVREGRWRKRSGAEVSVSAMPTDHDDFAAAFPWWDGHETTWTQSGHLLSSGECPADLVEYLGPIEPEPEPQAEPQPQPEPVQAIIDAQAETIARLQSDVHELNMEIGGLQGDLSRRQARIRDLETMHAATAQAVVRADKANNKLRAQADELRSEVSYVQRLLGESRQRVTHLEELVGSLRTINEAQEKSFNAANKANDDLQHRLDVVSKEWADQAATSNGLRAQLDKKDAQIRDLKIELDSLQQVPADSTPMTNNDLISRSDAVDAVVLAAVEHVVAIVARLHNTQVTPELHNTIVQAIGQLTAQLPEQHDAVIPPVVAEHCDAMPTLVQSVFYNIPDAG